MQSGVWACKKFLEERDGISERHLARDIQGTDLLTCLLLP